MTDFKAKMHQIRYRPYPALYLTVLPQTT